MQGDLAARQTIVTNTFRTALDAAGVPANKRDALLGMVSVPCAKSPLAAADEALINAALASGQGRALVDRMDETILADEVKPGVVACIAAAARADRRIADEAKLYMALWINMTGRPTTLLDWLEGSPVGSVPPPGPVVERPAIEGYLLDQTFFRRNRNNFPHLRQSVATGVRLLS